MTEVGVGQGKSGYNYRKGHFSKLSALFWFVVLVWFGFGNKNS